MVRRSESSSHTDKNPACKVLCKASKDPLLSPQKGHLSPKLTSLKNPTCQEQRVARGSDSSPPSVRKAGAERAQNVTGPRLSAPKRVPPPGDRDAGGRSLPFLSLGRAELIHSPSGQRDLPRQPFLHRKPTRRFVSGLAGNRGAHLSARPDATSPHLAPAESRGGKALWILRSESLSRALVVGGPTHALRQVLLGIQDREMCIPVPLSLLLEGSALLPRMKNTRFFLLGDRDPARSEGRGHSVPRLHNVRTIFSF